MMNIALGQLDTRMVHPALRRKAEGFASALRIPVGGVVGPGAKEEVRRVDTCWGITAMQNAQSSRNAASVNIPRNTMGTLHAPRCVAPDSPVAGSIDTSRPEPASGHRLGFPLLIEAFFQCPHTHDVTTAGFPCS